MVYHVLALGPALMLLLLVLWSTRASMDLCNLQLLYPETADDRCSNVFSFGIVVLLSTIGAVCWYASYKLRPVYWEVAFALSRLVFSAASLASSRVQRWRSRVPLVVTVVSTLLRTMVLEALRVLCHEICVLIIIALTWRANLGAEMVSIARAVKCLVGADDPRFLLSLWLGCGWAGAELIVSSYQLLKIMPLSRTVEQHQLRLDEEDLLTDYMSGDEGGSPNASSLGSSLSGNELEELALDELILMREKAEFEEQIGDYMENVPPAIITLWRLDTVLWQVGSCLLIGAALTAAQGCSLLDADGTYEFVPFPPFSAFQSTFWALVLVHGLSTTVWTLSLPRIGLTTVTYLSMLLGLLLLVSGLAWWDVLV